MKFLSLTVMITGCAFFATFAHADSQKPSVPNNVNASTLSSTSVRVSWNAAWDNNAVNGYNVYRDNGYYATVFATNYIDSNVSSGSTHEYRIVAFDFAQNFSNQSSAARVTTSTGGSVTGAVTPNTNGAATTPSGLSATPVNGNELRISWSQTSGAAGYNVYRDGSYYLTVNSGTSVVDRVDWGRDYRYSVSSFTSGGRHSPKSSEVIGNTAGGSNQGPVTQPPENNGNNNNNNNNNGNANAGSNGVPNGYNLVFSDDFRGNSLDTSKWNSRYRWGPDWIINGERQYYVDRINQPDFGHNPFEFDGEHLTITAQRTPDHLRDKARWQPYLSGALTTHNKFTMKYGYIEMRAKMPSGRGLWPAFWLLHNNDHDRRPEIDVVEMIGHQPNLVYNTYHHYQDGWLQSSPSFEAWGPDYSQGFHTYAVKWEPGLLVWYIDGVERNRYQNGNVSWEDMYLLVNLAVGGSWPGDPDGNTRFPARFTIDYIRAWKKP